MKVKQIMEMFSVKNCELSVAAAGISISDDNEKTLIPYDDMTDVFISCPSNRAARLKFYAIGRPFEFIIQDKDDTKILMESLTDSLNADMRIDFKTD